MRIGSDPQSSIAARRPRTSRGHRGRRARPASRRRLQSRPRSSLRRSWDRFAGRRIDIGGGRDVLAASNLIFAAGLTTLGAAQGAPMLFAGWLIVGVGSPNTTPVEMARSRAIADARDCRQVISDSPAKVCALPRARTTLERPGQIDVRFAHANKQDPLGAPIVCPTPFRSPSR